MKITKNGECLVDISAADVIAVIREASPIDKADVLRAIRQCLSRQELDDLEGLVGPSNEMLKAIRAFVENPE